MISRAREKLWLLKEEQQARERGPWAPSFCPASVTFSQRALDQGCSVWTLISPPVRQCEWQRTPSGGCLETSFPSNSWETLDSVTPALGVEEQHGPAAPGSRQGYSMDVLPPDHCLPSLISINGGPSVHNVTLIDVRAAGKTHLRIPPTASGKILAI